MTRDKRPTQSTEELFAERIARANVDLALETLTRPRGEPPRPDDLLPEGW